MNDAELIEAGKRAAGVIERAQLELGRLALEYAPVGDPSVKTGTYSRLREYADAIGVDEGTLRNYRATAHAWQGIDTGDVGFTVLKACNSVAHKDRLMALVAETTPATKSGRWTVPAVVELAKSHDLWTHAPAPRSSEAVLAAVRTARSTIAKLSNLELSYEEATDALVALGELRLEVEMLQRHLSGRAAKRDEDLSAAA